MQIIWNAGAPLTARQILSAIQSRRKWSLSTLMTSSPGWPQKALSSATAPPAPTYIRP